jgi:hypothetical protein
MLFTGQNIQELQAPLLHITEEELCQTIAQDEELKAKITRLRKIAELDPKAAKILKLQLPYFIGSSFNNAYRSSENFQAAHYMIVDVDECENPREMSREWIRRDPRIRLLFISPSGSGIKAVFKLATPCTDLQTYKFCYKALVQDLTEILDFNGKLDLKTCDATRVCFLAHDPNVYFHQ